MNQLTIRGFDDELANRIRKLASQEGISLNRAVLRLLRRGAGLGKRNDGADVAGDSLDHLIGTWTAEESAEMDRALEDLSHKVRREGPPGRSVRQDGQARGACGRPRA